MITPFTAVAKVLKPLLVAGGLLFATMPASAETPKSIRVANSTTMGILTIPDLRTFEHFLPEGAGVKAEVTYVPGAVRSIQALIADQADVAIATLAAGLAAVKQGQDIQVFALASGARPYLVLAAKDDVKELKDLEDKTVGVISLVDSTYYLPVMQMLAVGADPKKVRWQPVGGGAGRGNAILSGSISAAAFQVGQALDLAKKGPYRLIDPPAKAEDFIFKAFWAKKSFLKENPDLAVEIVKAHLKATREALDKEAFLKLAVPKLAPMTSETISSAYDVLARMGVWDPNDSLLNEQAGTNTVAQMVKYKVIDAPIEFSEWATDEYAKKAVDGLGRQ